MHSYCETIDIQMAPSGLGTITLRRPDKRNALSVLMREEISDVLGVWAQLDEIRAVIITGAGDTFSSGFDLSEFADASLASAITAGSRRYHLTLWSFPKPLIAAVNGAALAGGLDLATLCDLRLASEDATFGHPEIKFGAPPMFTPLRWIVGDGRARELCLTGRRVGAEEAERIGLVSAVVSSDELQARATAIAESIVESPPAAIAATKSYLTASWERGFFESFGLEHDDVLERFLTRTTGGPQAERPAARVTRNSEWGPERPADPYGSR